MYMTNSDKKYYSSSLDALAFLVGKKKKYFLNVSITEELMPLQFQTAEEL